MPASYGDPHGKALAHPWLRRPGDCLTDFESRAIAHPFTREDFASFVELGSQSECLQAILGPRQELRNPFFDRRLVEFSYTLPVACKVPTSMNKPLLRQAFASELPLTMARPSALLNAYIHSDLYGAWNTLMDLLKRPAAALSEVVDIDVLRGQATRLRMDMTDYQSLLSTYVLACWLDVGGAPADLSPSPD